MYIDTCWQPVLNPQFLRQSLEHWLGYVPISNIMLSHDSTTIEQAVGSSLFTREILAESLTAAGKATGIAKDQLHQAAADFLHNNAVEVYHIGERVAVYAVSSVRRVFSANLIVLPGLVEDFSN